ncbi:MAG: ATP-binding protein, partial [Bacteroidales bacterium]|nr:ATP-binding protein [Bacteroidales bacterium]MBN2757728.1 ATP-binding protein [Bacteroidales bacterium]
NLNIKLNNGSKLAKIKDVGNISTNKIINEVINNEKNIEFREKDIFLELEDQKIKIEEYYFRKIIEELLSNAIKFTIAGIKIQIKTEVVDNELVLTVRNEGSGITEEQIADIGAFMQFDRKKNEQQGLGLGLAIVKLIAELYNANFIVNSKPYEFFEVIINFKLK